MSMANIMAVAICLAMFTAGVYDMYVALLDPEANTVSQVLHDWFERMPYLAFMLGVLVGHLLLPLRIRPPVH